jgi:phytoene synthase
MANALIELLDGPDRLAVHYAPTALRGWLSALLVIDRKLSQVVRNVAEPLILQLRLAWWRDRFAMQPNSWPAGEPFLAALRQSLKGGELSTTIEDLATLVDLWEELATKISEGDNAIADFHRARGGIFFTGLAHRSNLVGPSCSVEELGYSWSAYDLEFRLGIKPPQPHSVLPNSKQLPRQLRALVVLHRSAMLQRQSSGNTAGQGFKAGLRLFYTGITGR